MKLTKVIVLALFFATLLFAQDFYVETLDEQKSSNNLLVLRFRVINNTSVVIHDATLKYCLSKSPDKVIEVEKYYIEDSRISVENVDSTNACLNIKMGMIPHGIFPNRDGFSVGVHYSDWKPRNKSLDFSNPKSSAFSKADNVALYIDDAILYGADILSQKTDGEYLPDAVPLSAFDGISVVLGPNEPYRFVWNHVDDAEKYQLTVLREDSTLVHSKEYTTNVADVKLPVGRYLWNVQAIRYNQKARPLAAIKKYNQLNILDYHDNAVGYRVGGMDTIVSTDGRKDSRLLNINWGDLADYRKWDTIHEPLDPVARPYDEDEGSRCWAIGVYNLNHHYRMANGEKGNVTLDEIVAIGRMHVDSLKGAGAVGPALAAFPLNLGGYPQEQSYLLHWALNIPEPKLYDVNIEFQGNQEEITKMWIDSLLKDKPIYVSQCNFKREECDPTQYASFHVLLVDGFRYRTPDSVEFHFINTDNYGTNEWRVLFGENWQFIYSFYVIGNVDSVRSTLPEVHVDTDSDGVMDFDEMYRFDSDYRLRDTDGDGIDDKTEIYSYVMREKIAALNGMRSMILPGTTTRITGRGLEKEMYADIDGDGKRAENDNDSDDDGLKDGMEDLNHNGFVDEGETDPFHSDLNKTDKTENEIPDNVVIYSLDYIRINDGIVLYPGSSENSQCKTDCNVVADAKEGVSVIVGAGAAIGDIYSKGQVWVRNRGIVGTVRYYGLPQEYTTILQDVTLTSDRDFYKGFVDINLDERLWPYRIPEFKARRVKSNAEKIVKSSECDTLRNGDAFKTIKVEAGGRLYFGEGEITVNKLQLDAGSSISFVKPGFSTILHVNEKIQWNTIIENHNFGIVASGFKLYYYGEEKFFVHGVWAGTLIAPNAKLVLGQTQNKKIYGQFLGNGVTVHQYSKIFRVEFNPKKSTESNTPFNVAWIGGRK